MSPSIYLENGVALRTKHLESYLLRQRKFSALEVTFENYLYTLGEARTNLVKLSRDFKVHLHGISTNIGSTDRIDRKQLMLLKKLSKETNAFLLSDHLCFTRINGFNSLELLPMPLTMKMLKHIGDRLNRIRDVLGRDFLLENISAYFSYEMSEMDEASFMAELHKGYGANFLLDVNNVYVSSHNLGFSPEEYLARIPVGAIKGYHIAGHEAIDGLLFDTHGESIQSPVKKLFAKAVARFGQHPTFLERDEKIPDDPGALEDELESVLDWKLL